MEINNPDVATCVNILKSKINSSPINLEAIKPISVLDNPIFLKFISNLIV